MGFRGMLFQSAVKMLMMLLAATTTTADLDSPISLPGCPDRCGNISIPYPFGLTEKCYYDSNFFIVCNQTTSDDPPKAFLGTSTLVVRGVTLDGKVQIMQSIAKIRYNKTGSETSSNAPTLRLGKFTISDTDNIFVAVGCDTQAVVRGQKDANRYEAGCISKCSNREFVTNDSCSGIGCCQTSLARGFSNITIKVNSFQKHSNIVDFNPCSYGFLVDKDVFRFKASYLKDLQKEVEFPMVAKWTIGDDDCATVKKRAMFNACQGNSTCYDPQNGVGGYRCKCMHGYQGNPYFPGGCQDIDECANSTLNNCETICVNTVGNYTCLCPKGYHGDGRSGGRGCIAGRWKSVAIPVTIGCSTGLGIPFLAVIAWWMFTVVKRRKEIMTKQEFFKRNGGLLYQQEVSSGDSSVDTTKLFTSKELERATDHYNKDRILGQGGQGTVYKGMLADGKIVAIKKSKVLDENKLEEFINEVVILSQINHRNVVKILGCCLETEVPLLVYEFIPNGTLFHYLHDPNQEFPITWDMRLRIAIEVADALSYLHSAASKPIYHRDIKSTNILLDEKYRAKVSDFGTSRSIDIDQTHVTTNVMGTFGYLDPEYFQSSQFTEKSDVYSFGVVLVELLTGQKPISFAQSTYKRSLATDFLLAMEENRLTDILDARVVKEGSKEAILEITKLAERCLNLNGKKRPTMKVVARELERIRACKHVCNTFKEYNEEEDMYIGDEITRSSEEASSSTMSCLNSRLNLSSDVEPLLYSI